MNKTTSEPFLLQFICLISCIIVAYLWCETTHAETRIDYRPIAFFYHFIRCPSYCVDYVSAFTSLPAWSSDHSQCDKRLASRRRHRNDAFITTGSGLKIDLKRIYKLKLHLENLKQTRSQTFPKGALTPQTRPSINPARGSAWENAVSSPSASGAKRRPQTHFNAFRARNRIWW